MEEVDPKIKIFRVCQLTSPDVDHLKQALRPSIKSVAHLLLSVLNFLFAHLLELSSFLLVEEAKEPSCASSKKEYSTKGSGSSAIVAILNAEDERTRYLGCMESIKC